MTIDPKLFLEIVHRIPNHHDLKYLVQMNCGTGKEAGTRGWAGSFFESRGMEPRETSLIGLGLKSSDKIDCSLLSACPLTLVPASSTTGANLMKCCDKSGSRSSKKFSVALTNQVYSNTYIFLATMTL